MRQRMFLSFWAVFCPFNPLTAQKNKILKKWKKMPADIIILHMCTIKDIIWCMVPEIWSMTDNFFVILDHFLPFYPPNSPKNQNFEKMKKTPGDIILHKCTKNHDHMLYCSLDTTHNGCNCYFSFWAIFYPFTSLTAQNSKFKKNPGDIIILQ